MHTVLDHPIVAHDLALLRGKDTGMERFRALLGGVSRFVVAEALRGLPSMEAEVETPLASAPCRAMAGGVLFAPILRAGIGMLGAALDAAPMARVGFIGIFRDHESAEPVEYYHKIPAAEPGDIAIALDPMLATGGSASAALALLKRRGFGRVALACVVACPEGVARVERDHPDAPIFTAAMDEGLNASKYILPGLGDAGDRLFGA